MLRFHCVKYNQVWSLYFFRTSLFIGLIWRMRILILWCQNNLFHKKRSKIKIYKPSVCTDLGRALNQTIPKVSPFRRLRSEKIKKRNSLKFERNSPDKILISQPYRTCGHVDEHLTNQLSLEGHHNSFIKSKKNKNRSLICKILKYLAWVAFFVEFGFIALFFYILSRS